jgi:hypothetical protein
MFEDLLVGGGREGAKERFKTGDRPAGSLNEWLVKQTFKASMRITGGNYSKDWDGRPSFVTPWARGEKWSLVCPYTGKDFFEIHVPYVC